MAKYNLIALTNPLRRPRRRSSTTGTPTIHLADVLKLPGVHRARSATGWPTLSMAGPVGMEAYMAVYEIEIDDI